MQTIERQPDAETASLIGEFNHPIEGAGAAFGCRDRAVAAEAFDENGADHGLERGAVKDRIRFAQQEALFQIEETNPAFFAGAAPL
jgi:hypothetical protein